MLRQVTPAVCFWRLAFSYSGVDLILPEQALLLSSFDPVVTPPPRTDGRYGLPRRTVGNSDIKWCNKKLGLVGAAWTLKLSEAFVILEPSHKVQVFENFSGCRKSMGMVGGESAKVKQRSA